MNIIAQNLAKLRSVLQERFGFSSFAGAQEEVFRTLAQGQHALLLMPTGSGKSLCYQLPAALAEDGLVVVLSPLIALMDDQTRIARQMGLAATFINSSLPREEREARLKAIDAGKVRLLFVTPERFKQPEFVTVIQQQKIHLLAVDEAHCVSLWGHDFRPEYSRIERIRTLLGGPLTLALTATATEQTQKDILLKCGIPEATVFRGGFARPNLSLKVQEVQGLSEKIRHVVLINHAVPGPKIVYCSLISTLLRVKSEIERLGLAPLIYHGEMPAGQRRQALKSFIDSDNALLLATPAFGLGINKPNIRMVVHAEIPGSLEAYFQEVGRAGRDGLPAESVLLYDEDDVSIQREFIEWGNPDAAFIRGVFQAMRSQASRLQTEGVSALKEQMTFKNSRDFRVEASLQILTRLGAIQETRGSRLGFEQVAEPSEQDLAELQSEERRRMLFTKLLEMVSWVGRSGCRMQGVLAYLGEVSPPCGLCDHCTGSKM